MTFSVSIREKSSRSGRIYFGAPQGEKNRQVCLIIRKGEVA